LLLIASRWSVTMGSRLCTWECQCRALHCQYKDSVSWRTSESLSSSRSLVSSSTFLPLHQTSLPTSTSSYAVRKAKIWRWQSEDLPTSRRSPDTGEKMAKIRLFWLLYSLVRTVHWRDYQGFDGTIFLTRFIYSTVLWNSTMESDMASVYTLFWYIRHFILLTLSIGVYSHQFCGSEKHIYHQFSIVSSGPPEWRPLVRRACQMRLFNKFIA